MILRYDQGMNTHHEPIGPNHPAVEALADAIYWALSGQYGDFGTPSKGEAHAALAAALPHLTADDLRNTPAGKQLMAEGWDALIESMSASGEFHDVDLRTMQRLNPYRGGDA